jgi:hypothetical protein
MPENTFSFTMTAEIGCIAEDKPLAAVMMSGSSP